MVKRLIERKYFWGLALMALTFLIKEPIMAKEQDTTHIFLLGASVGKAWDFPNLPKRKNITGFTLESTAVYDCDKSSQIDGLISRSENKPDYAILKQCAAYFPIDMKEYDNKTNEMIQDLIKDWIPKLQQAGITPVIATVVPITKHYPLITRIKRWIKTYITFIGSPVEYINRELWNEAIIRYNDWAREYASTNGLALLDLEAVLRISKDNRYLDPDLSTDGLHINEEAYQRLDDLFVKLLEKIKE